MRIEFVFIFSFKYSQNVLRGLLDFDEEVTMIFINVCDCLLIDVT